MLAEKLVIDSLSSRKDIDASRKIFALKTLSPLIVFEQLLQFWYLLNF
jgi:hypothetical protein